MSSHTARCTVPAVWLQDEYYSDPEPTTGGTSSRTLCSCFSEKTSRSRTVTSLSKSTSTSGGSATTASGAQSTSSSAHRPSTGGRHLLWGSNTGGPTLQRLSQSLFCRSRQSDPRKAHGKGARRGGTRWSVAIKVSLRASVDTSSVPAPPRARGDRPNRS